MTDDQIQQVVNGAVSRGELSWLGYSKDEHGFFTVPVLSKSDFQFARAILAARPDGFALVPTVPTDNMIVAFAEQWYSARQTIDDPQMNEAYASMLAVAPQPGEQT